MILGLQMYIFFPFLFFLYFCTFVWGEKWIESGSRASLTQVMVESEKEIGFVCMCFASGIRKP